MKNGGKTIFLTSMACLIFSGCAEDDLDEGVNPEYSVRKAPLTAQCSIAVNGYGTVDLETDYVPNVTWCENGNAPTQALNAQSCAARTFAYYKITTGNTPVENSQGDQVYLCTSRTPTQEQLNRCKAATNVTSGRVMTYKNKVTAGFFVAGSKGACLDSECNYVGSSSDACYVSTQKYVTYNWGKSGTSDDGFSQSSIGWINDKNYANRGCMSQNGASCLANLDWGWENILRYFYGADINIEQAEGTCVTQKTCDTTLSASGTIIDDQDACFSRNTSESWYEVDSGYNGHLYYTYVWDKAAETTGTWTVNVTRPGTYEVFAYIQSDVGALSEKAPYTLRASGVEHSVNLNLTNASGWMSLGTFTFSSGGDQWVKLTDASGEAYTNKSGKRVVFDAIKFEDAVECSDACTANATQCVDGGIQSCEMNAAGCYAWSSTASCGIGKICQNDTCVDSCTDICASGAVQCADDGGVQSCVTGNQGCLVWSESQACSGDQICKSGKCVDHCQDECNLVGERQCAENGYVTCGQYDEDSCLEWSLVTACDDDQTCENGACNAEPCEDECDAMGQATCVAGKLRTCGQYDDDACLEFRESACENGEICMDGACIVASCEDECLEYSTKCSGETSYVSCGRYDSLCLRWGSEMTSCEDGQVCLDGLCQEKSETWNGEVGEIPARCLTEIDGRPSTIIDDLDPCFVREYSTNWSQLGAYGHEGHLYYAYVTDGMPSAVGTWYLKVKKSGKYTLYAYIESGIGSVSNHAPYTVRASGIDHLYGIDLNDKSGWFKIGDYDLTADALQYVQLNDATGETDDISNRRRIVFDAIQVVPYGTAIDGDVQNDDNDNKGDNIGDNGDAENDNSNDGNGENASAQSHKGSDCSIGGSGTGSLPLLAMFWVFAMGLKRRRRA